jgi:hypothetical protein
MKIAAEKYAARAGHGNAAVVGVVTGFSLSRPRVKIKASVGVASTFRGRLNMGCTDIADATVIIT